MSLQARGGIPRIRNLVVPTTGYGQQTTKEFRFESLTTYVIFKVTTNDLRIYFSQDDFDNDENFWTVTAGTTFEAPIEERCIWMRGVVGSANVDLMTLHRKG